MSELKLQKVTRALLVEISKSVPMQHYRIAVEKRTYQGQIIKNEMAGFPDIAIIHRGSFYGIELKSKRGTVSHAQRLQHEKIVGAGARVFIVRDWSGLQECLREIFESHPQDELASFDLHALQRCVALFENTPQKKRALAQLQAFEPVIDTDNATECPPPPFH